MNGREFFKKYRHIIKAMVLVEKKIPVHIRKKRLSKIRNYEGKFAMLYRYVLVRSLAKKIGDNVSIFPNVYLENVENLIVGDNVSIHQMCYLDAEGGIEIGNNVSVAHRSTILSSNHGFDQLDIPIKYQNMKLEKTVLEDDIWIGCGCTILAGVHIGTGCVIGANSIVTHNVKALCVVAGNPARVIKKRI